MQRMDSVAAGELAIRTRVARIGRAFDNDIRLDNDSVSAHHAELRQGRDGTFAIIDLGSTNGVWVNGEPVSCRNLQDGDTLELGEVRLWFRQSS
jgi:pSer/pThr/pTyr-binding forkhead associated (FHA) protein